ncbi:MAG: ABC transporter ATP-binding protein [Deltaproteobacteria bacterium]|nr:ABC transporter ATP-binding protein [Kofleriaceae bacterium]
METLSVAGLRKAYDGVPVLQGLTFELRPGECYGLLGPNGAGKTTTLRCALGLTAPDAGEVRLSGLPVPSRAREARMRVGIVPQMDNLDPDFTAAENLLVYGRYFGLAERAVRARIPHLLDFAGLAGRAEAKISALSGGMKRRLTLARALVNDPDLLILDEPTTGLDPEARLALLDTLQGLRDLDPAPAILHSTHLTEEAERSDRVLFIDRGRLAADATPAELRADLGDRTLRIEGDPEETNRWLSEFGLSPGHAENNHVLVSIIEDDLARVLPELNRTGRSFSVGPPSLADAYTAIVGRGLESVDIAGEDAA